jgi:pyruvate formate lyase activating enzyme
MTVEEVLAEVRKDAAFYWRSGGGMTLTGGEACLQAEFARTLLKAAGEMNFHTAVETCGYVSWTALSALMPYTDTFLYDIKHMDSGRHLELTGQPNELVLENARRLASSRSELILRTQIIPGKNDDWPNLLAIARFAVELSVKRWDLIPYHRLGEGKYGQLGTDYGLTGVEPPEQDQMREKRERLTSIFARVEIENQ